MDVSVFYSHVNYSVTKIHLVGQFLKYLFYSHVNYSVTKISYKRYADCLHFYSHVNYSVTKISPLSISGFDTFTVT
mgnify:CR=1 FL=1